MMTMMTTTNFSEIKNGRNKGFWPEYLPMHVHSSVYAILVQAICSHKYFKFFSVYSSYANIEMSRKLSLK